MIVNTYQIITWIYKTNVEPKKKKKKQKHKQRKAID